MASVMTSGKPLKGMPLWLTGPMEGSDADWQPGDGPGSCEGDWLRGEQHSREHSPLFADNKEELAARRAPTLMEKMLHSLLPAPVPPPPILPPETGNELRPAPLRAPHGCPVAGAPIPPGHACSWCLHSRHPGESVLLVLEDEQEALREVYISELRATNERLQADVKHKQRLLDARGKVLACCRRSLANEQLYREQDAAHYKRLLASSEEQLAFRDRQVQALTTALEAEVTSRLKADAS